MLCNRCVVQKRLLPTIAVLSDSDDKCVVIGALNGSVEYALICGLGDRVGCAVIALLSGRVECELQSKR